MNFSRLQAWFLTPLDLPCVQVESGTSTQLGPSELAELEQLHVKLQVSIQHLDTTAPHMHTVGNKKLGGA